MVLAISPQYTTKLLMDVTHSPYAGDIPGHVGHFGGSVGGGGEGVGPTYETGIGQSALELSKIKECILEGWTKYYVYATYLPEHSFSFFISAPSLHWH